MKISVITVCYNEGQKVLFTLDSILAQTSVDFEMIICDGGSSDDTFSIVMEYKKKFETKGINFIAQSKSDSGIYYGMNNAIELANSDYCIFMNIGDRFHDNMVLEDAIRELSLKSNDNIDVLYGDLLRFDDKKKIYVRSNHKTLSRINEICHQVAFIRTDRLKERPYDTVFKLAADYEYWMFLKDKNSVFRHFNRIVADYRMGGRSEISLKKCYEENEKIRNYYQICDINSKQINSRSSYFYGKWGQNYSKGYGWAQEEECASWAIGNKTDIYFNLKKKPVKQYELLIYILKDYGYSNDLYVNDTYSGHVCGGKTKIIIPMGILKEGINTFSIKTDDNVLARMDVETDTSDPRPCNIYISRVYLLSYSGNSVSKIKRLIFTYWRVKNAVIRRILNVWQMFLYNNMVVRDSILIKWFRTI